ncbi:bacteriohemerythrin [Treponema phagedenis]|uniref:bacteriohemerythrin n=1 Tax=Treponema phagedenis TaxID=162 RepID=UPI0001F63D5F|nr:bacteriohemerythrin [Treponema phagedenis]EFW38493.1 hemerythrin HHE cation binding domain protein [Treponema phagedenis F0421]TYT79058.1 bacteriohemerythrin [Treponema phagedenis]
MECSLNFKWKDSLSVGYNTIDLHHKKLLSLINDFEDLLSLPQAKYKVHVGRVLMSLCDYTVYHFSEEEKIMRRYKYPQFEEHAQIHAAFVQRIKDSLVPLASGNMEAGAEFCNFLGEWLLHHIAVTDQKWAEFIQKNHPDAKF